MSLISRFCNACIKGGRPDLDMRSVTAKWGIARCNGCSKRRLLWIVVWDHIHTIECHLMTFCKVTGQFIDAADAAEG